MEVKQASMGLSYKLQTNLQGLPIPSLDTVNSPYTPQPNQGSRAKSLHLNTSVRRHFATTEEDPKAQARVCRKIPPRTAPQVRPPPQPQTSTFQTSREASEANRCARPPTRKQSQGASRQSASKTSLPLVASRRSAVRIERGVQEAATVFYRPSRPASLSLGVLLSHLGPREEGAGSCGTHLVLVEVSVFIGGTYLVSSLLLCPSSFMGASPAQRVR
ncbi:hypothetical protein P7K49_020130 [Saguinus oedipus]|uniref:Uncharacterized protein n=1 Tax=Saguinus oedipus TaxID=9490 RepID=A0ABQ9UZG3_SAGOE|nr:hypothetical protein P7K49_020130 [Saguinus oedipus]